MARVLSKAFVKAVYSDVPEMSVTPADMGEAMISLTVDGDSVKRIATATGTVASAEISVPVTITIPILKTTEADNVYNSRWASNGVLDGEMTIYDDANKAWIISDLSMSLEGFTANAGEAHRNYNVKGNMEVNKDLIASLEG